MTCYYDDNFTGINGSPPNTIKWTEVDADNLMDIQSNKLNFFEGGAGGVWYSYVTSRWYFDSGSDFDIQIDFLNLSYAGFLNDWSRLTDFQIRDDSDPVNWARVVRATNASFGDGYFAQDSASKWSFFINNEKYGKLRITRSGSTIKGYKWNNSLSRWEWNGSTAGVTFNENFTGNTWVRLFFRAPAQVYADVDNFLINAGCANITGEVSLAKGNFFLVF